MGGLLGPLAGVLVGRAGLRGGWVLSASALGVASAGAGAAAAAAERWAALATMEVFGAGGYMATSAVLILWARRAWPHRAGAGTSWLFVALATGQALGSAGFGVAREHAAAPRLAAAAAGLCLLGAALGLLRRPRAAQASGSPAPSRSISSRPATLTRVRPSAAPSATSWSSSRCQRS